MAADVSSAKLLAGFSGRSAHREPPKIFPGEAGERRIDIQVHVRDGRDPVAGRMWERSAWLDDRDLVAESPARPLPGGVEAALRMVAVDAARSGSWRGDGVVGFGLNTGTGVFAIRRRASLSRLPSQDIADTSAGSSHLLQLRLGAGRGAALTVWGVTRGDALRRAYLALSHMRGADSDAHLRLLQRLLASPDYCAGITGSQLMRELMRPA
jgi:hypothetical protein